MVIMASSIARGRVRTTATTKSRKMAAIVQLVGSQRQTAKVYSVLPLYWIYLLWSIDTCQTKVSADHVVMSQAQV